MHRSLHTLTLLLGCALPLAARANNVWLPATGGFWHDPANWSDGVAPDADALHTQVLNAGSKTVVLNASTPDAARLINKLTVSAPAGSSNTLSLQQAGLAAPLRLLDSLVIDAGGEVRVAESALEVDGPPALSLVVAGGRLVLESGRVATVNGALLRVGRGGAGFCLVQGGELSAGNDLQVGSLAGASGTLRITGGQVRVQDTLALGLDPGSAGRLELAGGQLVSTNADFTGRIGEDGEGTFVAEAGTAWLGDVSVGRKVGAHGTLNVHGAEVHSGDLSFGRFAGAVGRLEVLSGQLLLPQDTLWIGREGAGSALIAGGRVEARHLQVAATNTASGTLTLQEGTLTVISNLTVGMGVNPGQLLGTGGELVVTNAAGLAAVEAAGGTVILDGGRWQVDQLRVADPGTFEFRQGVLRLGGGTWPATQPLVVGDGVHPATLELAGGVLAVPGGLRVSANARVIGCGTIVGPIDNQGTVSTNCGGVTPPNAPMVHLVAVSGTLQLTFASEPGRTYTLEYRDQLGAGNWTALPGTVAGDGQSQSLQDAAGWAGNRFYRVRVD